MKHKNLDWMQKQRPVAMGVESNESMSLRKFKEIENRHAERDKRELEGIQRNIESLLERRGALLEPPQDTFPNGSLFIVAANGFPVPMVNAVAGDIEDDEDDFDYEPRKPYSVPTARYVVRKDEEGVWWFRGRVMGWKDITQVFHKAKEVQQVTEYVVLPQGDKFDATGQPVKIARSAGPTRGQKAAATRKANAAAKAAAEKDTKKS